VWGVKCGRWISSVSIGLKMLDTSPTGHFAYWTVRLLFGHFAYETFRLLDSSPTGHFAYYLGSSPTHCSSFYQQDYQSKIKSDV